MDTPIPRQRDRSREDASFESFDLDDRLMRGIEEAGFLAPRPVQLETIPAALEDRDVLGLAETGTGKTAAFALPVLDLLLDRPAPGPRALVVAPTRELATQIATEIERLARFTKVRVATLFGGVGARPQVTALRKKPDILVACPGRLLDLHGQGHVDLSRVEVLVLDEADHMFDMGFLPDLKRILNALPEDRQNLLFSATMPPEIRRLADRILQDPHVVELNHSKPAKTIQHALYPVAQSRKTDLLVHLLGDPGFRSAIVFLRTKHRARRLARDLERKGHRATCLQGNMSQGQRDRAMKGFRDGSFDVLVATDIASRGIDVADISHVISFDVPNTPELYTHRIGRTGRAEQSGRACTFVTNEDDKQVRAIEKHLGAKVDRKVVAGYQDESAGARGGAGRGRSSGTRSGGRSGAKGGGPRGRGRASQPGRPATRGGAQRSRKPGPRGIVKPQAADSAGVARTSQKRPSDAKPFGSGVDGPSRDDASGRRGRRRRA